MNMFQRLFFAILVVPYLIDAAKILVVFPFPSKSHNILGEGINRVLMEDGHEITYITAFPKKNTQQLRYIDISDTLELRASNANISNLKSIMDKESSVNDFKMFFKILTQLSNMTLTNTNIQNFIKDPKETFDLVIIEWMFSDVYAGLSALYNCPYIWFSSVDPHGMVLSLIDEAPNTAYISDGLSASIPPFNFFQRAQQLLSQSFMRFFREFYLLRIERLLYEEHFVPLLKKRGRSEPSLDELRYNASIMLGNSHVSLGTSIRLPQNYKPVGGYHIDLDVKPLPEDLKKIMDNAKNGVIYFSMGSNLNSKDLPEEVKRGLLTMFGGLKYTVIWKFEEQLSGLPNNVHILQWAPQTSILDHPNCKLFITHGGLLSLMETVHFGKPIIGIPVMADQYTNVEIAVLKGFGLKVDLSYNIVNDLKIAIADILGNPKYEKVVKQLNTIYHDRPVVPAKELGFWVNHVLRTRGATHLRSPALMVPWYQKLYLDLLASILLVIYTFVKLVKCIFCSKKKVNSEKKKN